MKIHPMITFHGNCREALEFYRECFGGELVVEKLSGDIRRCLPQSLRNLVVRAKLITPDFTLYGSDLGDTTMRGRISILIGSEDVSETATLFEKLSTDGKITTNFEDVGKNQIASVIDRFGVEWLFLKS
ncbi:VOC family protein [Flavobacterium sp. MAH-1]|uniref:VOC family protein n=1 Tax=Flavobacterium agri TaxID=2743471 RepID=A0A7Y9C4N9_9FLAO|nr:VOC family protein [Flavobacterium agri]NUY79504.1 VOC family protein [Flavobacterium agri]NYA69529.1 VOC family protein [Flavobacterium agri]